MVVAGVATAICGATGTGKTTLLNLFERHRSTTAAYRCSVWR
jgi:ABC-type lipoprotein export system ATPase subunit